MKFSFRVTILGILLTLITITVVALGFNAYRNVWFAGNDLSSQILEQTSQRIDQQAHAVLSVATLQGRMNQLLLQSGQYPLNDFSRLAPYWLEVMHAYPRFTRLSLGIEATGEWYYVRHTPNDKLALGTLRRNPQTNKLELSSYWPENFPAKPFYFNQDKTDEDPRLRPWYRAAKAAGKQTWSPTYVFFGAEGIPDVPGVSCSTPVFGPDGSLVGALTSSFGLYEICDYLATLRIGHGGFAIMVEERADGTRQVIGHPRQDVILRTLSQPGKPQVSELVPTDELSDLRVRDFLKYLPPAGDGPSAADPIHRVHFIHDSIPYLGSYSPPERSGCAQLVDLRDLAGSRCPGARAGAQPGNLSDRPGSLRPGCARQPTRVEADLDKTRISGARDHRYRSVASAAPPGGPFNGAGGRSPGGGDPRKPRSACARSRNTSPPTWSAGCWPPAVKRSWAASAGP
jgi:hypothetical protein